MKRTPAIDTPIDRRSSVSPTDGETAYTRSVVVDMLMAQRVKNVDPPICFCTDIDFTLIYQPDYMEDPNFGPELMPFLEQLNERYRRATRDVVEFVRSRHIPIIPVSGIDLPMLVRHQTQESLPRQIDVAVLSVGTEIWLLQEDGSYVLDTHYKNYIENEIGFKRDRIYSICVEYKETIDKMIACGELPDLQFDFQPRDKKENVAAYKALTPETMEPLSGALPPQPYKISYNFIGTREVAGRLQSIGKSLLKRTGYPEIRLLLSQDRRLDDGLIRYNIDVVPVTKDAAINYLKQRLGCFVLYAGDSQNDKPAIENAADVSIIVGNARQDLLDSIRSWTRLGGRKIRKYRQNNRTVRIYLDSNHHNKGPESLLNSFHELEHIFARYYRLKHFRMSS